MPYPALRPLPILAALLTLGLPALSRAAQSPAIPPAATDFFVSSGSNGPNAVAEYTADGRFVQTLPFPANTGSYAAYGTEYLRGIAVNDAGDLVGFNGTFTPQLSTFYPTARTFTARTAPGWKISNNVTSGSIGVFQGYSFVDTENFGEGDPPAALIRFNPDGTSQDFGISQGFGGGAINLTVGLDGKLYALRGSAGGSYTVDVYDPVSLQLLRTVALQVPSAHGSEATDLRNLAVDAQGTIYVIELYSYVYHLDAGGALLQTAQHPAPSGYTEDIKIDPSGQRLLITAGAYGAKVFQTDPALSSFSTLVQLDTSQDENPFLSFSNAKLAAALNGPVPTAHLLWDNTDGKAALWDVAADGTAAVLGGYGPYTDGSGGLWRATALATGADGVSHLLWDSPDGHAALWDVTPDGTATVRAGYGPYTDNSAGDLWYAAGLSVGPDNVVHLLWTNPDGKAAFWNVGADGTPAVLAGYGPYLDGSSPWGAVGISTGPDNVSHLLWDNADGRAAFWNVSDKDGTASVLAGYGPYTDDSPDALWAAVGVATGPDNVSHLLWDNADGKAAFWNVSDTDGTAGVLAGYGPYTDSTPGDPFAPNTLWAATGLATGPDGVSHLLWNNADGHVALWSLDGVGNPATVTGYGPYTDGMASNLWSAVGVSAGP